MADEKRREKAAGGGVAESAMLWEGDFVIRPAGTIFAVNDQPNRFHQNHE
jgi:hypothetical protein